MKRRFQVLAIAVLFLSSCSQLRSDPAAEQAEAARQAKHAQWMKEWSAEQNRKRAMWATAKARGQATARKRKRPSGVSVNAWMTCRNQADSVGLAVIARGFVQDGIIEPPDARGYFSYDAMGLVRNFLYKNEVGDLVQLLRRQCRQHGLGVFLQADRELDLTPTFRHQVWDSYQRTPYEYRLKHYQPPR